MKIEGRVQKCRGSKRTWHRHKNNKMSEKFKRINNNNNNNNKRKKKKKKKKRQYPAVLGICFRHTSTGIGPHPMSYQMIAERYFPRDKTAVLWR